MIRNAKVRRTVTVLGSALLAVVLLPAGSERIVEAAPTNSESCLPGDLRQKLNQVRARFGSISVVSSYRPGARIAGSGRVSLHASCRAVDFRPNGASLNQVAAWLRQNHHGGLGIYPCMNHIHIDNGPSVQWTRC